MLKILIGILTILVTLLLFIVFFILKQIRHLYDLHFSSGGLQLPVEINQLHLTTTSYLPTEGPYVLLFGNAFCATCQQLLQRIEKKRQDLRVPLIVLFDNKEEQIQNYVKQNRLSFTIHPLSDVDREAYQVNVHPFAYLINNNTIIGKRAVRSVKQIIEMCEKIKL
ncbi:peroxiredoxin family protein [Anoxybacillus sp. D401a]|uniref:peroxiredoxin family protein n=1 Tax=Anoxybacillus sp. D401a TaxID=575112 RepID=UPI003D32E902